MLWSSLYSMQTLHIPEEKHNTLQTRDLRQIGHVVESDIQHAEIRDIRFTL